MRTLLALALLVLSAKAAPVPAEGAKPLSPAEVERDRPKGRVTVAFKAEEVGLLGGVIAEGEPPHMPISLDAKAGLKDSRARLYVVLVGKALTHVHALGIDPSKHFAGKTVEAKGKVRYIALPRITRGGKTEVPPGGYTHYEIVIDSLDDLRVVR